MKIKGIIEKPASINGNQVEYQVDSGGRIYVIISKDKQAVKDYLFLRKGQSVEVVATEENEEYISYGSKIELARLVRQ